MDISNATRTITTTVIAAQAPHMPHVSSETLLHIIIAICSVAMVVLHAHN